MKCFNLFSILVGNGSTSLKISRFQTTIIFRTKKAGPQLHYVCEITEQSLQQISRTEGVPRTKANIVHCNLFRHQSFVYWVNASYGAFQNWMTMPKTVLCWASTNISLNVLPCVIVKSDLITLLKSLKKIAVVLKKVCFCLLFYTFLRFFQGTNTSYGLNQYMISLSGTK